MVSVSPYLVIIDLSKNGLNSPVRRQRVSEWVNNSNSKTQNSTICCLQGAGLASALRTHMGSKWKDGNGY